MTSLGPLGPETALVVLGSAPTDFLDRCLGAAVAGGARSIVVDASAVDAIPSVAITAMLVALRSCRRRDGYVLVRNPGRRAMCRLDRTGLRLVFQVDLPTGRQARDLTRSAP